MTSFNPLAALAAALVQDVQRDIPALECYPGLNSGERAWWQAKAADLLPGVLAILVWA
jgi:hypothetical protein